MKIATICYVVKEDKVLMVHHTKKPTGMFYNRYNAIGGKLEQGETILECTIREFKEETGTTLTDPKLIGLIYFPNNLKTGEDWIVYQYIAHNFEGDLPAENVDGMLEWIPLNKILELPLSPADYISLPWILNEKYFYAEFKENTELNVVDSYSVKFLQQVDEEILKTCFLEKTPFDSVVNKILRFRKDRNWITAPEDLAKSAVIEAAELLEHFQWDASSSKSWEEKLAKKDLKEIGFEIADVIWYLVSLADTLGINILDSLKQKVEYNSIKYPLDKILADKGGKFYKAQKAKYREKNS